MGAGEILRAQGSTGVRVSDWMLADAGVAGSTLGECVGVTQTIPPGPNSAEQEEGCRELRRSNRESHKTARSGLLLEFQEEMRRTHAMPLRGLVAGTDQ